MTTTAGRDYNGSVPKRQNSGTTGPHENSGIGLPMTSSEIFNGYNIPQHPNQGYMPATTWRRATVNRYIITPESP
jgi:hypothetical protein